MEIKDFIKESLSQIVEGIDMANQEMNEKGAFVVSSDLRESNRLPKSGTYAYDGSDTLRVVREIEFEISIAVSDSTKNEGKGGLRVASLFHANGGMENSNSLDSINRMKFSLPLALPNVKMSSKHPR